MTAKRFNEPKHTPSLSLAITLTLGIAGLAATGCKKETAPPPPPPIVQVETVKASEMPLSVEFIGQLDSPQNVEVRARVEAFVDKMLFIEGSEVKEGDPLFLLDKKPLQEQLDAANGRLAESTAALKKYQKDVARLEPLAQKRAIPQQDLDNALATVDIGKANVYSAEANVVSAQIDLGYCDVNAPSSGLIGAKQVSVGSLVGKGDPTLMATISQLDPIWFYCNVSETDYLRAKSENNRKNKDVKDIPITLLLTTGQEHPEKGQIVFMDRAVDVKTGTLRMRVAFPNPDKILRPGMFGRIIADLGKLPDSILVTQRAVTELQGKNFIWVVDAENKASQRPVTVGKILDNTIQVTAGLKAGERIIIEGIQKVREGMTVQPKSGEAIATAAKQQAAKQVTAAKQQAAN
ncbi:MAG: membrane fusion protein (multidrug efflux system) [Lentimonas sp.]|jgi:membrane fusion protein (multidrug efflux system)